jgi:hypothetical protein
MQDRCIVCAERTIASKIILGTTDGRSTKRVTSFVSTSRRSTKWVSTWPKSRRSTNGCAQCDFHARDTFSANYAPFLRQNYYYLQMDRSELPLDARHLGVQSGASKMIFEPIIPLVQTMHLSVTRLKLSPNRPRHVSNWPTSRRSNIGGTQNDF